MKAAVLHEFKTPLTLEDVPRPTPAADEVLIQVEVCGVCHSDLHVADGDWPQFARIVKKPLILGHEIIGRVVERGAAVQNVAIGDRIGIPWVQFTCGECEFCREGNENLCAGQRITGVTVDGGYAEYAKAPASHVARIPDALPSEQAAPLLCAGVTVHRALKQAKIRAGQRLAVFGVGGLGHLAVQIGRAAGAEVTAIDVSDEKLALAKSLGAARTLNAATTNVIKELRATAGVHVALVTSAAKSAYDTAFYCVRPSGTLLAVGLPATDISFPPIMMAATEINIKASAVGTREDLHEILEMGASGVLHCQVASRPLADLQAVLGELSRGEVSGRIVLRL
ncbi:MAG TPA: zinc-dependent alcohol dehydrogenase [Terriglobales bacterium]|jgi:propanol-preferring alcohol dehydrogenase|nr:zinc-dependent alcohol dehydrogenase [Terriglobales bacterium]